MAPAKKKTKKGASTKAASGVIEIDLDDVEVRDTYDGDDPRPGFYTFECVDVVEHTSQSGNEGFKWVFVLRDNPLYEGWTRFLYSNTLPKSEDGSTLWKTGEIMLALAGGKTVQGTKASKVSLNLASPKAVAAYLKKAKLVRGRVQRRRDSEDDDPQFELGKVIALDEAKMAARRAAEAALEDDEDDDEDGFEDADEFEDDDEEGDEEDDAEDDAEDEDSDEEDEDEDFEEDDDDEEEDDEDDDEEEESEPEPPAAKKKTAKKAAAAKKPASKVTNISDAKSKKAKKK